MSWDAQFQKGLILYKSSVLSEETWLDHGVTAALQDGAPFNLGLKVGDDPEMVAARRRMVANSFRVTLDRTVFAEQVHGRNVAWVGEREAGAGSIRTTDSIPATDGLATMEKGLLLATQHADCVPILLVDPVHRAVSAIHAGWKGTASAIVLQALEVLREHAGSDPCDCKAAIGPSAGECCYEVGEDLREPFDDVLRQVGMTFSSRLSLSQVNRRLLLEAGLSDSSVDRAEICTICGGEMFFSHRRQGKAAGRMCSFILRNV